MYVCAGHNQPGKARHIGSANIELAAQSWKHSFPQRELQKCYRTHLVRALLWNMEFSFFQLFLLEWLQQVMQKKKKSSTRVCAGLLAFKRVINGDWFCVCECKCVCAGHERGPLPPSPSVHSGRSLWCFGEGFISPPPTLSSQWKEKGISAPHLLLRLLWHTAGSQPHFKVHANLSHSMAVLSFNLWLTLWGPLECACIQFMYRMSHFNGLNLTGMVVLFFFIPLLLC